MKEKLVDWWNDLSDNKKICIITALITGCGFLFFKAGYHACEHDLSTSIKKYGGVLLVASK